MVRVTSRYIEIKFFRVSSRTTEITMIKVTSWIKDISMIRVTSRTTEITRVIETSRTIDLFEAGEKRLLRSSSRLAARLEKISEPGLPSLESHSMLVIRSWHSKALGTEAARKSEDRRTGGPA